MAVCTAMVSTQRSTPLQCSHLAEAVRSGGPQVTGWISTKCQVPSATELKINVQCSHEGVPSPEQSGEEFC